MDSTAAFAPDSAFHPEDVLPMSAAPQPHQADDPALSTPPSAAHWLSHAMALWLQPSDALPDGTPPLTPSGTAH
jgi:hypothetical protein